MSEKNLEQEIKEVVTSIFSEKEEAEARKRTEEALGTSAATIEELTTTLEGRNNEVAELETKVSEAEERIADLESELEAARTETQTSNEKLAETESQIEDMVKDKAADERMTELEEAGVARTDKEGQRDKVREMTDEDFAAYAQERIWPIVKAYSFADNLKHICMNLFGLTHVISKTPETMRHQPRSCVFYFCPSTHIVSSS